MKIKPVWIIIGTIVFAMAAGILYLLIRPADPTPASHTPQTPSSQAPGSSPQSSGPQSPAPTPGRFVAYSEPAVAAAQGRKVLFFYASWCPQCRELEQSIEQQGVPDGMTIFKVDYDTATALKQRYGVTLQTTMVEINNSGSTVQKHTAYDEPSLPAVLKALGQ